MSELELEHAKKVKATMRLLELDTDRVINDHMAVQAEHTEELLSAAEAHLERGEKDQELLNRLLIVNDESQAHLQQLRDQVQGSVDAVRRKIQEFNEAKKQKIQELRATALAKLAVLPTKDWLPVIEQKAALFNQALTELKQKEQAIGKRATEEIIVAQANVEQKRVKMADLDTVVAERREKLAVKLKALEEVNKQVDQISFQTNETTKMLVESKTRVAELKESVWTEEREQAAEAEVKEKERIRDEAEKECSELASILEKLVRENAMEERTSESQFRTAENTLMNKETDMDMKMAGLRAELTCLEGSRKGASYRLHEAEKQLLLERGGKSIEELAKGLKDRAKKRKDQQEKARKDLEALMAVEEEVMEIKEADKMQMEGEMKETMERVAKEEAGILGVLKDVQKEIKKVAAESKMATGAIESLQKDVSSLEEKKKFLKEKVDLYTSLTPSEKKVSEDVEVSTDGSGDDVVNETLEEGNRDSQETVKAPARDNNRSSSSADSDESGAEKNRRNRMLDDSLFGGDEGDDESENKDDGDFLDLTGEDEEQLEEESGAGDAAKKPVEVEDLSFTIDLDDDDGEETLQDDDDEEETLQNSDINTSAEQDRFPRDIFLTDSPQDDLQRCVSPPASLSIDGMDESVLESDVSMQSIWD